VPEGKEMTSQGGGGGSSTEKDYPGHKGNSRKSSSWPKPEQFQKDNIALFDYKQKK
jgi:DsbC/DsbD-like thiol-disulfide interchange protein